MHRTLLLLLPVLLSAPAAAAPQDAWLGQLAGEWDATGTTRGQAVHYRVHGHWILKGAWLAWDLKDVQRPPAYQAQVFFGADPKAQDYVVHWLDQFGGAGARVVGTGKREGATLTFSLPYADGTFRDTLTLAADGASATLLIEAQQPDGSWSTFGSYQMRHRGFPPGMH
ncbi:MAG: DUF1579 family protein [Gammaproteobacteria bacterium]|nr:DUF1579 family protein [Gammaproteobacteria bacterium]